MKKETSSILILFLVAFIWGSAFIAVDDALANGWKTFPIVAVRGIVGALVLSPFVIKTKFWRNKKSIINGVILGVLYFLAFYLQTYGQELSNAINAAFLTVLYAVFAPLILRLFFKEKQETKVYIGCLLSVIGVFFLTILAYGSFTINIGDLLLVGCAIFFALHIIYAKKSTDSTSPIVLVFLQLITMGLLSAIFMPISGQTELPKEGLLSVLYCAVFSSALASLGQIVAQKYLNSSKASVIMAQEVLIATILASIVAKEIPSIYVFVGGALMFLSVIVIEVSFKKKLDLRKYKTILIDVDDTLLDFQKSQDESIVNAYKKYNIDITPKMLSTYKNINKKLWEDYEKNIVSTKEIFETRFNLLNKEYNLECDGIKIEELFRENLNTSYYFIDGALDFVLKLKEKYTIAIVTNGKKITQETRLKLSGLDQHFKYIFISEDLGYKKPEIEFFNIVESTIPDFKKEETLIIGDSLTSDIQGGINFGIDTCYFSKNKNKKGSYTYKIENFDNIIM